MPSIAFLEFAAKPTTNQPPVAITTITDTWVTRDPVNIVVWLRTVAQMAHYDGHFKLVLVINIIMLVLTTIAVLLRAYARIKARIFYYLSDGLCLFSYLLSTAAAGIMFDYLRNTAVDGVFKPHPITDPTDTAHIMWFQEFYKMSYISQLVFTFDYAVVKFSILALLWDIFGVNRSNKRFIAIVSGTCIIWAIIFTFLCAFRCKNPVDSWTTDNPPELCIHTAYVFLPFESTNLFFDILILSIPVFAVQELKLSTWKKLSVMGIFLLGARGGNRNFGAVEF
uniref:Rhodopsin domain-containing protein n=1 Tax=Bionectria ochroleuca TaxID=29856 RepID=A0A0B7JJM2_BIOOC